ncbi:hypothetical protein [Wukongibacter baidiensis]
MCNFERINEKDREEQISIMEQWFKENYEDPGKNTPYDSREGGYIYIWGGPFDAGEQLGWQFGKEVPEDVIDELVELLEDESYEWARIPKEEDLDYDFYSSVDFEASPITTYINSIDSIKSFLYMNIDPKIQNSLYRMVFVNVISIMETYLADFFTSNVLVDQSKIRKLVETTKEFSKEQFKLANVYSVMEGIDKRVKNYLLSIVWHNLPKVNALYSNTLDINLQRHLPDLTKAIKQRHDLIHRNGRTKDGTYITTQKEDIVERISKVGNLIYEIEDTISWV